MYSPPEEEALTRAPHTSFCAKAAASAAVAGETFSSTFFPAAADAAAAGVDNVCFESAGDNGSSETTLEFGGKGAHGEVAADDCAAAISRIL